MSSYILFYYFYQVFCLIYFDFFSFVIIMLSKINYFIQSLKNFIIMKRAIFTGSFDPFTLGHLHIVQMALQKFDEIIINIGTNPQKKTLFSTYKRIMMAQETIKACHCDNKIVWRDYDGTTADLAMKEKVYTLIRGIRIGTDDIEKEKNLAITNQYLGKIRGIDLETEFIYVDEGFLRTISSTAVKSLCQLQQFVAVMKYVSPYVHQKLAQRYLEPIFKAADFEGYLYQKLVKQYEARAYHNLSHIAYMLNMLQIYQDVVNAYLDSCDIHALTQAIFLHDYVYNPLEKNNEEMSIKAAINEDFIDVCDTRCQDLILVTKHIKPANNESEALMADLDLSILGTFDDEIWKQYNHAIRQEYAEVPEKEYIKARIEVLESFLKRDIFQTTVFHNMFENKARQNIINEIERLKGLNI